jgi:hypothetical protein
MHRNGVQSCSGVKVWIKAKGARDGRKTANTSADMYIPRRSPVRTPAEGRNEDRCFQARVCNGCCVGLRNIKVEGTEHSHRII